VDPLSIEILCSIELVKTNDKKLLNHLPDDITRLQMPNRLNILIHSTVIVTSGIEMVSVLPAYVSYTRRLKILGGSQVKGDKIQRFPIQHV
jgi:hypothetical protein